MVLVPSVGSPLHFSISMDLGDPVGSPFGGQIGMALGVPLGFPFVSSLVMFLVASYYGPFKTFIDVLYSALIGPFPDISLEYMLGNSIGQVSCIVYVY